jgi:hypothetical protein
MAASPAANARYGSQRRGSSMVALGSADNTLWACGRLATGARLPMRVRMGVFRTVHVPLSAGSLPSEIPLRSWATITSPPVDLKPGARCKLSKCAMRPSRLRPPQNPNVLGELELLLQLCDDRLSNGAISSPMARRCASDWQPPASRKQAAIFFCWRRSSGKSWPRGRSHERISFGSECQRLSFKSAATSPSPTILSTAGSASLARHRFYRRKAVQTAPHPPLTT